ncbi:MAG: chorismate-binding protein [Ichthyobacteriaceae bacterium]|nr:chorismate-binding protein [Ichthyobacteriaceae bacterium]
MGETLKYKEVFGKILESKLPFVLYKKPEEDDVYGIMQKNVNIWFVKDFDKDEGFVFSPYENEQERVLLKPDAKMKFEMDDLDITSGYKGLNVNGYFDQSVEQPDSLVNKIKHINIVEKAISDIKEGKLSKVVISREELWKAKKVDFAAVFQDLVNTYNDAFVYIWFHPMVGMWIGATPELLIERDDDYIHATSLAATRPLLEGVDEEWGDKEKDEQQMVTDFVLDTFEKNLLTSIQVHGVETVQAGGVEHLKTDVTGELTSASDINYLINSLHPTPAVCGVPFHKAQRFLKEHEGYERNFYAGFLGEINMNNHTELYVNLRCMQVVRNGVKLFVGGGITKDSNAESEWDETVKKSNTLKDIVLNHLS